MVNELLDLSITSREGIIFKGKVKSITSYNDQGKFDILPYHANFISLLDKEIIYTDETGNKHNIDIDSALLRLKDKQAEIYLGVKSFIGQEDENKEINGEE